jgi:DNA-binding transcriptional regulator YdaS (Cro superfamily)
VDVDMTGLERAIDYFAVDGRGGQAKLARELDVAPMTVSHWKRRGVPADRCADIERATAGAVTRADLRPELFGDVVA